MRYLILICFCLLSFHSECEINKVERAYLISILKNSKEDSFKIGNLILLSANYIDSTDLAFYYNNLALQLSSKLNSKYGIYQTFRQRGRIYEVNMRDYYSAIKYYKMAIDTMEFYHIPTTEDHSGYVNVLNAYFFIGDFTNAMKVATSRLALFEQQKNVAMQAYYCNLIGFIYLHLNNSEIANKYYSRCVTSAIQLKDSLMLANAFTCTADVFTFDKNYGEALSELNMALKIYKQLYNKRERIAYVLFKIGNIDKLMGDYAGAESYTRKAIELTKIVTCNEYDVAAYYINAGDIYTKMGNYTAAKDCAYFGLKLAEKIHHSEDIRDAYLSLSTVYESLKHFDSAFIFSELYHGLKDSINNNKTVNEIEQIHTVYEVDKKDKEIVLLNQQSKLRESDIARQRLSRNVVIVICLFVVIIGVLLYSRRILKQENIFNAEINKQKNKSFEALVTVQDKERKRIAQDIHDSLGSILSSIKLTLARMEDEKLSLTEKQRSYYDSSVDMLEDAIAEMRLISHNIMPAVLSKFGLIAALKNSFESISEHSDLAVHFSTHDFNARLAESLEISIYRIIMELMNNIVKHADAKNATIQIIAYPGYLNITVEDDGKGFDYVSAKKEHGIGLVSTTSRVDFIKGKIEIDSTPGDGTTVIIEVPLTSKN